MHKDKIVATFDYETKDIKWYDKMPLGFTDIQAWIDSRFRFVCAHARDNVYEFVNEHLGILSMQDFINKTHCVSIHDTYWIKREDNNTTWESISPYTNPHSKIVQDYALENIMLGEKPESIISPIFELSGNAPCAFKRRNGKLYYIKAGNRIDRVRTNGQSKIIIQDPYAEYYTSVIAKYLNFNAVYYNIGEHIKHDGTSQIITESEVFTNETYGSITSKFIKELDAKTLSINIEKTIEFCRKLSDKAYNTFLDTIFLDCLTLNLDRHRDNTIFIVNNDTQEVVDIAPMFDYNCAFLAAYNEESKGVLTKHIIDINKGIGKRYKYIKQYKDYTNELQSLKQLKLVAPDGVGITDKRLQSFNSMLQCQVNVLLNA